MATWLSILWIDALCIIQDSQEDWPTESAKMSDIYANGTLNIAAAFSRNGTQGLFCSQPIVNTPYTIGLEINGTQRHIASVPHEDQFTREVDGGPLNSRAWTL
jgi:Heterokaryon incompatibility protein (HET)